MKNPSRPALHNTRRNVALSDAVFGPLSRIKAFIVGYQKFAISIIGLFIVFGLAWWFRYEPMGQQGAWEQVWDRWYGRVCVTPLPAITNVHGIACSEAEVGDLSARISAEAAPLAELDRLVREAAQRAQDEQWAQHLAELEQEKKVRVAAQERDEALLKIIHSYLPNGGGFPGRYVSDGGFIDAPNKWRINQLRTDGHSEEYIAQQVMPWRNKLLAAGAPKEVADEYFGGDPFLKPGVKP